VRRNADTASAPILSSINQPTKVSVMSILIPRLSVSFLFLLTLGLTSGQLVAADELKRVAERKNVEKVAAVVEAINVQNRIVTLRSLTRDASVVMEVGDEVRNLDQVKVGDRVVVEFLEAMAVDLKKGGGMKPSAGVGGAAARAKLGEKPAAVLGGALEVVATIIAIDADEPSVTLRGPEGKVIEVLVQHPEKLAEVDVGDQVIITYKRAVAVAVTPSPIK
jgi:hypothetical protein